MQQHEAPACVNGDCLYTTRGSAMAEGRATRLSKEILQLTKHPI